MNGNSKIQRIQISKISKASIADIDSERSHNTEQILKQARNKYYLRREHLHDNRLRESLRPEVKGTSDIKKSSYLPPLEKDRKFTLVLDLDETLVHFLAKEKKFKLRPGCIQFLKDMSQIFEVVIFTAAAQDYADFILNYIEKESRFIRHRLYRQHCIHEDGVYVKDLSLLGRDLAHTLIVDNIRDNFERQPFNGIEILTWLQDPTDRELYKLSIFLKSLVVKDISDIREYIKAYSHEKWKSQSPNKRSYLASKTNSIRKMNSQ